jgi:hypothetical protein
VTSARFRVARADGRSNAQVVSDLVKDAAPGTIYAYDDLTALLSEGTGQAYSLHAVQSIVRQSAKTIARLHSRAMRNVPGVGYRVAPAAEHRAIATTRETKADRQIRMAILVLKHVKWGEMDQQSREAHLAHLQLSEALYLQQRALDKRMRSTEQAIERLHSAVLNQEGRQ